MWCVTAKTFPWLFQNIVLTVRYSGQVELSPPSPLSFLRFWWLVSGWMRPFISGRGGSAAGGLGLELRNKASVPPNSLSLWRPCMCSSGNESLGDNATPQPHPLPLQAWAVCRFTSSAYGRGQLWNGFRIISLVQRKKKTEKKKKTANINTGFFNILWAQKFI